MDIKPGYYQIEDSVYHIISFKEQENYAAYYIEYSDYAGKQLPNTHSTKDDNYGTLIGYKTLIEAKSITRIDFLNTVSEQVMKLGKWAKETKSDVFQWTFKPTDERRAFLNLAMKG